MKTCHNCACDPVCNHTWNGWEMCGNWIQKPEKPLTNADRIRAMSDEELAKFIANPCQCEVTPERDGFRECGNDLCLKYLLDWLQQPAEEDT